MLPPLHTPTYHRSRFIGKACACSVTRHALAPHPSLGTLLPLHSHCASCIHQGGVRRLPPACVSITRSQHRHKLCFGHAPTPACLLRSAQFKSSCIPPPLPCAARLRGCARRWAAWSHLTATTGWWTAAARRCARGCVCLCLGGEGGGAHPGIAITASFRNFFSLADPQVCRSDFFPAVSVQRRVSRCMLPSCACGCSVRVLTRS